MMPLWQNLILFTAGAITIWLAGSRLSRYAEVIAHRTGLGKAFIGALLLGGITSLPEGATTVTASALGNAPLAVNNIIGGVAIQVTLLAVADAVVPGRALSARIRKPVVLLQGVLLIFIITLAAAGIAIGDISIAGVGVWTSAIMAFSLLSFFLIHQHRLHETWEPEAPPGSEAAGEEITRGKTIGPVQQYSTFHLALYTVLAGLAILVAGIVVSWTGEGLAAQTGLGSSFVGVVFVAGKDLLHDCGVAQLPKNAHVRRVRSAFSAPAALHSNQNPRFRRTEGQGIRQLRSWDDWRPWFLAPRRAVGP